MEYEFKLHTKEQMERLKYLAYKSRLNKVPLIGKFIQNVRKERLINAISSEVDAYLKENMRGFVNSFASQSIYNDEIREIGCVRFLNRDKNDYTKISKEE